MKKIDFNKLLKSVLLILTIILMFLKISARASADSLASNQQDVVEQYILDNFGSSAPTVIAAVRQYVFPYCQYFGTFTYPELQDNYTIIFSTDLNVMPLYGKSSWTSPYAQISVGLSDSVGSRGGLFATSARSVENYYGFRLMLYNGTWALYGKSNFTGTISNKYSGSYFGGGALVKYAGTEYMSISSMFGGYGALTTEYGYGPVWLAWDSDHIITRYGSNNIEPENYVSSDIPVSKIILSSSLNDTQYALRVRLDDFASFSAAVSNQPSILVTVNVEGTEVSKTFTYESSYYHFNLASSSCYFDIPLSEFGIDQGTDYSFLTDIKLDMVISSPGGSSTYMYQDSYNFILVGSIPQAVLSPTVVPMPSLTPAVVKSDQEIINIYNQLKQAGNNNGFNISFNDSITNYTFPEWVNQIEITIRQVYDAGGVSYKYQSAISSYSQYNQDINVVQSPSDYIFMNFASQFYDVCIINLDVYAYTGTIISGSDLPVLQSSQGSVILISDRYFNHQQAITSLDLLSAVQNFSFNSSLFFNFMNDKLSAFEGSVINGFNSLIGLDNVIIQRLDYGLFEIKDNIDSNTGKIVSAIENINFPSTGGSYSLPALSDQLQLLFIPTLQWEQINYNDYLDSLGVLALPFEFTFDVQSVVKSNYSSNMTLEINELNVPLGSDNLVLFSDMEQFNFDPKSIFPNQLWQIFQYLAAFALVAGEAWFTYCHIFRKEDK